MYSDTDIETISTRVLSGLRDVVTQGLRVVPACHVLSYVQGDDGLLKMVARMNKPIEPVSSSEDVDNVMREARLFALSNRARRIYVEASFVAFDAPRELLPLGEYMGSHEYCAAVYLAHVRQAPQVMYAPIFREHGHRKIGSFVRMSWVSPNGFPNVIPIELYGDTAGEA